MILPTRSASLARLATYACTTTCQIDIVRLRDPASAHTLKGSAHKKIRGLVSKEKYLEKEIILLAREKNNRGREKKKIGREEKKRKIIGL